MRAATTILSVGAAEALAAQLDLSSSVAQSSAEGDGLAIRAATP
jgi:hypothetical protein